MSAKEQLRSIIEDRNSTLSKEALASAEDLVKKLDTNPERPVVVSPNTQAELVKGQNVYGEPVVSLEDGTIIAVFKHAVPEAEANRNLFFKADGLLQIAEMYFDSMTSRGETDSIPFQLTSKILNELKGDESSK